MTYRLVITETKQISQKNLHTLDTCYMTEIYCGTVNKKHLLKIVVLIQFDLIQKNNKNKENIPYKSRRRL
jgi:hypothetical protein